MHTREETYLLENGTGRLEVRGTGAACGLFLDGSPVVYHWNDCAGSIGQDVCYFGEAASQGAERLRAVVENGPDPDRALADQFLPLLSQLPSAEYRLTLAPVPELSYTFDAWDYHPVGTVLNYYPYDGVTLLPTLPDKRLDQDRVLEYMVRIEDGARPVLVTATVPGAFCEFVLDGHHKLAAYDYCRVRPWRLRITAPTRPLRPEDWPSGKLRAPRRNWPNEV